jgi:hypothetical protein
MTSRRPDTSLLNIEMASAVATITLCRPAARSAANSQLANRSCMRGLSRTTGPSIHGGLLTEAMRAAVAAIGPDSRKRLVSFLDAEPKQVRHDG